MEKLDIFDVKVVNGLDLRYSVVKNVNLCIDGLDAINKDLQDWDFDVQDEFMYQKKKDELYDKCLRFKGMIDGYYDLRVLSHGVHRRMICDLEQLVDKFK